jgi:hypothetical protein
MQVTNSNVGPVIVDAIPEIALTVEEWAKTGSSPTEGSVSVDGILSAKRERWQPLTSYPSGDISGL